MNKRIIAAVFFGLCCAVQAWSDTNSELFLTFSTDDLAGKSTNELAEILAPLEAWYIQAHDIRTTDISEFDYMTPEEKQRWDHDCLLMKILTVRQEQATKLNYLKARGYDPVTLQRTNEPPPSAYFTLDELLEEEQSKKQPQQGGPAYPPQSVGSPDP